MELRVDLVTAMNYFDFTMQRNLIREVVLKIQQLLHKYLVEHFKVHSYALPMA